MILAFAWFHLALDFSQQFGPDFATFVPCGHLLCAIRAFYPFFEERFSNKMFLLVSTKCPEPSLFDGARSGVIGLIIFVALHLAVDRLLWSQHQVEQTLRAEVATK